MPWFDVDCTIIMRIKADNHEKAERQAIFMLENDIHCAMDIEVGGAFQIEESGDARAQTEAN